MIWALNNLRLIAIGALVLTLAGAFFYINLLKKDIQIANSKINTLQVELAVSQASVESLSEAIDVQNKAIFKLKESANLQKKQSESATTAASIRNSQRTTRANTILEYTPDPTITDYQASVDAINREIQNVE